MEKYKLLSSVDPAKFPVIINKKFTKLTLGNRPPTHNQESSMSSPTQKILFFDDEVDDQENSYSLIEDENEIDKDVSPEETHCSDLDTEISKLGLSPEKEENFDGNNSESSVMGSVKKIKSGLRNLGIHPYKSFNTQNMPSLNISGNDGISQELWSKIKDRESDASILTISSTVSKTELDHNEIFQTDLTKNVTSEVIILDESSENELPLKESFPVVSDSTEKSLSSTIQKKLNAFFEKIPTQSECMSFHYKSDNLLAENSFETSKEDSIKNYVPVSLNETENYDKKCQKKKHNNKSDTEEKSQVVNISAKIKINIEIEEHELTSSDDIDQQYNESDEDDDQPIVKKPIVVRKKNPEEPKKDNFEIDLDADVQSILTETYGEAWKTKEVLNSVKKQKETDLNDTIYSTSNLGTRQKLMGSRKQHDKNKMLKKNKEALNSVKMQKSSTKIITREKESQQQNNTELVTLRNNNLTICDSDSESELKDCASGKSEESSQLSYSENFSSSDSSFNAKPARRKGSRKKLKKKLEFDFTQNASSDSDNTIFETRSPISALTMVNAPHKIDPVTPQSKILNDIENPGPSTKRKLFSKKLYNINNKNPSNGDECLLPLKNTPKQTNKKLGVIKDSTPSKGPKKQDLDKFTDSPNTTCYLFSQRDNKNYYGFLISLSASTLNDLSHPEALRFRKNFRVMKEELTTILYNLYNEKIFNNQLKVSIKWNKKLLTTAGRCTNMLRNDMRLAEVDLSEKVLTSADRLRCTLIHELCHAAAWIFDGEKKGHTEHWKKWAKRANEVFTELPKITVCHHYDIEYKYTYQCVGCGAKTQMHSKTKKVENIQCKYCKGTIQVFINKRNKDGQIVQTPVRAASGFAKFVQQKYKIYKTPKMTHAETMKILSQEFTKINLDKN